MATTILFVDDEDELRFMVASYFELAGIHVLAAGTTEEAVRVSTGVALAAIVLDVNLPGEGSAKLMAQLKVTHPDATIILYTGRHADEEAVQSLLLTGADCYLPKDGSLERLLAAVKEACD
jgi:DNA-binding response OmpR family regulator